MSLAYSDDYRDDVFDRDDGRGESLRARDAQRALQTAMVSYCDEIRPWAVILRRFTPASLADAMYVDHSVGVRACKALVWHGIVYDTGEEDYGPDGPESIYEYVPLPPGPREHFTGTPEWQVWPCGVDAPQRGMPVRLISDRDRRRIMSSSMEGRRSLQRREQRYQQMQQAVDERRERNKAKAQKEPKWKRKK